MKGLFTSWSNDPLFETCLALIMKRRGCILHLIPFLLGGFQLQCVWDRRACRSEFYWVRVREKTRSLHRWSRERERERERESARERERECERESARESARERERERVRERECERERVRERERELKESGGLGGPNHQGCICVSFPVVWIRGMISGSYVSLVTKIH